MDAGAVDAGGSLSGRADAASEGDAALNEDAAGHGEDASVAEDAGEADAQADAAQEDAGQSADADVQPDAELLDDAGEEQEPDAAPVDYCVKFNVVCEVPTVQCRVRGVCNPETADCSPTTVAADGSACDDGDRCTRNDTCLAGVCVGSNPVVCAAPDNPCMTTSCSPESGLCLAPSPKADGTNCSNGAACGYGNCSFCQAGTCTSDIGMHCGAGNTCSCGGVGQQICTSGPTACADGFAHSFGICQCVVGVNCGCGGPGEPCCTAAGGAPCSSHLVCGSAGRCVCGGEGQPCCGPRLGSGTTCNVGLCSGRYDSYNGLFSGTCSALCGGAGQPCCAGSRCANSLACGANNRCNDTCGGMGEPCCSSGQCDPGNACIGGSCSTACGEPGQPCCFHLECTAPAFCTTGSVCRL